MNQSYVSTRLQSDLDNVHIEWKHDTIQNDFKFTISCIIEWLMFTNQFDRISYGRLHASLPL